MKKYIIFNVLFIFVSLTLSAQFDSEDDVLSYLGGKTFFNKNESAEFNFSPSSSIINVTNSDGYDTFVPVSVSVLTNSLALVIFGDVYLNPQGSFLVDCSSNLLKDRSNNLIFEYKNDNIEEQNDFLSIKSHTNHTERQETYNDVTISNGITIRRDPNPRKDISNVFYKPEYTLFDLLTDEPIFPDKNGIYTIYYATNEQKTPKKLVCTAEQLSRSTVYKFKNFKNCQDWCNK